MAIRARRKTATGKRTATVRSVIVSVLLAGLAAGPVLAEQLPPAAVDSKACAPGERLKPDAADRSVQPPRETTGEHLSDRLARTDGVLCPPNVDPDIRAPAPGSGRTPVIPPPGTSDSDPVQPK